LPNELSSMRMLGLFLALLFYAVLLFNGLLMFFLPRCWLNMPPYVALHGILRRNKRQFLDIRAFGCVLSILLIYALARVLLGTPSHMIVARSADHERSSLRMFRFVIGIITCSGVMGSGLVILLRPLWWLRRFPLPKPTEMPANSSRSVKLLMRLLSCVLISAAAYAAWKMIES
jgi:hypothetical protein